MTELAQIIREPAREAALTFETDSENGARLDDVLLAATRDDPAVLPLLEFTLDKLYDKRDPQGRLTHAGYRELNGVEGALALTAEQEFAALGDDARIAFGPVFGALVNLADVQQQERPVRRQTGTAELSRTTGSSALVDSFARARLLVLDRDAGGQQSVSVVHEALFSHWGRLKEWITENRDLLRVRGRVEQAAARWDSEGRPRDLLLPDGRLMAEAQDLLRRRDGISLSGTVVEFVKFSAAAQNARLYRRVAAVVFLAVELTVAAVVSWYQWESLGRNRLEAKLLEYRQAVRAGEQSFFTRAPSPESAKRTLKSVERVLALIEELRSLQGQSPEEGDFNAAKFLEYRGILKAQTGDWRAPSAISKRAKR